MSVMNLLFLCDYNAERSCTAEVLFEDYACFAAMDPCGHFADFDGVNVRSAGIERHPDLSHVGVRSESYVAVSARLLYWANVVFVMEPKDLARIRARFDSELRDKHIFCLDIPDHYGYLDPVLIRRLEDGVRPVLRALRDLGKA